MNTVHVGLTFGRWTDEREAMVRGARPDRAAETNPVAAAFTRLMTWCQR